MAEEQLTLVDGMSASLRRIYLEAERLNKRILSLKADIKSLEKPASLSYIRRELKETEKQAQQTERAIKAMKTAEAINSRYKAFSVGKNGNYYVNGIPVANANRTQMAENYVRNVANANLRKNRLLWESGRLVNGMTFDQRYGMRRAMTNPLGTIRTQLNTAFNDLGISRAFNNVSSASSRLVSNFLRTASVMYILGDIITRLINRVRSTFIEPQSQYISNFTRVALTNDKKKTPQQMMDELYDTASRTRAPADATFMLYNRIALSGVKASNERIRRFVESFNKVTAVSGTTGQENRAVMLQLAQGIGSNRLGGDEFRSISEQAPLFKFMLAKGMGVNPGALKQMGADGKLTAEAILSAMEKVQDQIDEIFKDAPLTIDQSITILQNKWQQLINKQFVGYIAIRDLIKDIVRWMDTPRGQKILTNLIRGWNIMMFKAVEGVRKFIPFVLWILEHLKLVSRAVLWLLGSILAVKAAIATIKLLVMGFKFYTWFVSAAEGAVILRTAIQTIGTQIKIAGAQLHTWIPELLIILGLALAISKILPALHDSFKENAWVDEQLSKKYSKNQLRQAYYEEQRMNNSAGIAIQPSKLYSSIKNDRTRLLEQYRKDHPKEGTPEYYEKMTKNSMSEFGKMVNNIGGMTDSSKNQPMQAKVRGGKLDSVGKINDKISIDNDGIEMMKTIAERQWVMQNEVTVPQSVAVTVTKEADISEESIAQALTGGMRRAVASSMRGAAA